MTTSLTSRPIKQGGSLVFGAFIATILLGVLCTSGDLLAWLSFALGLSTGWAIGILLSPYKSEQERFMTYAKVAAAFVTGWAISKIDRVLDVYLDPATGPLILNEVVSLRVMVGFTAFVLAMVVTYGTRKYFSFGPGADNPPHDRLGDSVTGG